MSGEIRVYMGKTEKWLNISPIHSMNLDATKWDRIPPMSRTFLGGGSRGRRGPNWVILGVGVGGLMYAIVSPDVGPFGDVRWGAPIAPRARAPGPGLRAPGPGTGPGPEPRAPWVPGPG